MAAAGCADCGGCAGLRGPSEREGWSVDSRHMLMGDGLVVGKVVKRLALALEVGCRRCSTQDARVLEV